jgi:putative oxidoreductase
MVVHSEKHLHHSQSLKLTQFTMLPLRLVVGYGFMAHGYAKLAKGPEHFISILAVLGVPAPGLMGWLTIGTELIGGLALLLGIFVIVASIPLGGILLVAALTVHLPYGFSSIKLQAVTTAGAQFGKPGYELDLLYLACLLTLVLGGSGPLALGPLLFRKKHLDAAAGGVTTKWICDAPNLPPCQSLSPICIHVRTPDDGL